MPKEKKQEEKKEETKIEYNQLTSYSLEDAIQLTKDLSKTKFDASVEVHVRLGIDPKKGEQQIRTAVSLPHGTGKQIKIAAFVSSDKEKAVKEAGADYVGNEELIAKIKKTEKTDFEVAVAEPELMKDLGKIAKILGTRGLMPSPKNDTVTNDPAKAVKELKKGKISVKTDDTANIHTIIGKVSFDNDKLADNFNVLLDAINKVKPAGAKGIYIKNISISSSMGPGVKVVV